MKHLAARLRRLDQRGYSLTELMFVAGIAGIAIASIVRFTFTSRINLSRQEVATDLYATNARIGSNLRADLGSAQVLLANYAGTSAPDMTALMALIRASVVADGAPAPVAFTMPANVATMNDPDLTGTAAATWGNEVMYICEITPVTFTVQNVTAWGGCTCTASTYAVERLQFVYDYLSTKGTGTFPGLGPALRLVQWRSAPFIDYSSSLDPVNSGRSPEGLSETAATVLAWGYNTAVNINAPQALTTAFYTILTASAAATAGANAIPYTSAPASIGQSSWAFLDDYDSLQTVKARPNLNQGRISNSGSFGGVAAPYTKSIAYNTLGAGSPLEIVLDAPGSHQVVPKYAQVDYSSMSGLGGPGFPGGFEVAIMGPSGQRQVFMRHVIMSTGGAKPGTPSKTYMAHEAIDEVTLNNNGY